MPLTWPDYELLISLETDRAAPITHVIGDRNARPAIEAAFQKVHARHSPWPPQEADRLPW